VFPMAKGVSVGPSAAISEVRLKQWRGHGFPPPHAKARWKLASAARKLFASLPVARPHGQLLSLVLCVGLAIFVTKAASVFTLFGNPELPPCLYDGRLLAALAGAASCCAEDVSVGLGCLLLGGLALCWRPRLVMPCLYIAALAALVLLAVDAHLFAHLRCFL